MKILKWILITIVIILGIIVIWAAILPKKVNIQANIAIDRPYQMVFHHSASYLDRVKWDPWLEMEPTATSKFNFQEGYVGSTYEWNGEMLGIGKMQVDSVQLWNYIGSSLFFGESKKPSLVEWKFKPNGNSTDVTWSFSSQPGFPFEKVMYSLFVNASMKKSLNKGLENFKKLLESKPVQLSRLIDVDVMKVKPMNAMVIHIDTKMSEIPTELKVAFGEIYEEVAKQKLQITGTPFTRYTNYDEAKQEITITAGVPVEKMGTKKNRIKPMKFDGRLLFKGVHIGPYEELGMSYQTLMEAANDKRLILGSSSWEFYEKNMSTVKNEIELETILGFEIEK